MTVAAELLKSTRLASGASARALSRQARTAPARLSEIERSVHDPSVGTLDRVVRAAGWQIITIPTRAPTAAAVASSIDAGGLSDAAAEEKAFRALLSLSDGLASAPPDVRVALCVTPPRLIGDRRFDAAIAGLVEYHLHREDLPVPAWVDQDARSLHQAEAWVPDPYAGADIASQTPEPLRRRGVLLAERELAST